MSLADELQKLTALRDAGSLTPDEFARAKAALLDDPPAAPDGPTGTAEGRPTDKPLEPGTRVRYVMTSRVGVVTDVKSDLALVGPGATYRVEWDDHPPDPDGHYLTRDVLEVVAKPG